MTEDGHIGLAASVADAAGGATATVEGLIAEADEALAQARVSGELAATRSARPAPTPAPPQRTLVLADDDPKWPTSSTPICERADSARRLLSTVSRPSRQSSGRSRMF
jgi:hypothetical protein